VVTEGLGIDIGPRMCYATPEGGGGLGRGVMGRSVRTTLQKTIAAATAGFVLGIAGVALAGTAYSAYGYYTVAGTQYRNRAIVTTTTWGAWASTYAGTYPYKTVPAGYLGMLCRLYNSSGVLVRQDGYYYNSSPCIGVEQPGSHTTVRGNYYSYGKTQAWNGSGYATYLTFKSPNQTY